MTTGFIDTTVRLELEFTLYTEPALRVHVTNPPRRRRKFVVVADDWSAALECFADFLRRAGQDPAAAVDLMKQAVREEAGLA